MVFPELLDSKRVALVAAEVMYSVRRKKETPAVDETGLPRALGGRMRARSCGWTGGGFSIAEMSKYVVSNHVSSFYKGSEAVEACYLLSSFPSNTPGIPTRSITIPSSASASMFSGCSRASRDAKLALVYCPLERPVLGISRSFGGHGGGGRVLE